MWKLETGAFDSKVNRGVRVRRYASTSSGRKARSAVAPEWSWISRYMAW